MCDVQPRIESRSRDAELSKIEKHGKTTFDQSIRTRNFKARNERIETGALVKSQKWRKVSVDSAQWRDCLQSKANGQCYKRRFM